MTPSTLSDRKVPGRRLGYLAVAIVLASAAAASAVAHIPGPVPAPQAIANAQQDSKFLRYVGNLSSSYPDLGMNYTYTGYNDVGGFPCGPNSPIRNIVVFLFPFHSLTTTTLFFQPRAVPKCVPNCPKNALFTVPFGVMAVEVNPSNGAVYSIRFEPICT
jgi:hypothetical protein